MAGIATSGVTYYELYGSGTGEISQDGSVTRKYQIAWSDLQTFIRALVGGYVKLNNTNFYYTYPDQDKDWPSFYSQETSYDGIGAHSVAAGGQIAYAYAIVTARYSALKFDPNQTIDNVFVEELDWSAEQLSIPGGSFKTSGGDIIGDPVRIVIPTVDYTLTLEGAPSLPGGDATLILAICAAPLNDAIFLGAAPKTMMYKGARATRTTTNQGAQNWKIVHKFCYRPIEWTKVWSKTTGQFEEVTAVTGGAALYGTSNLKQLLPR